MIRWFTSSINNFRFAEFINPAIAPRPKAVGDTLVQSRLGWRDVAPIGADLPVRQAHPVGLSIDDCRFSIEQGASNRKSKIENRKFPGSFMIPWQGRSYQCHRLIPWDCRLTIVDFRLNRGLPIENPKSRIENSKAVSHDSLGGEKLSVRQAHPVGLHKIAMVMMLIGCGFMTSSIEAAIVAEREPMTLRIVAVNPSSDKNRTVPIRIDLPQEVKPTDILEQGDMEVEFDTDKSLYYVHKPEVTLAPKQMRVFEVIVRDVWFIPSEEILGLRTQTELILKRLGQSEYADSAKSLGESILNRLSNIEQIQVDETISRKQRIGAYRRNLLMLEQIKDDLTRLEKLLSFTGGPPIPEMLEESPLKSDAPSTTTTWLVIFLIVIFMGLLAGQFFFTWHRRIKHTTFSEGRSSQFPQSQSQDQVLGGRPEVAP